MSNDKLIEFLEIIKDSIANYELVIIPYVNEIILCLNTLAIPYTLVYPTEMDRQRITDIDEFNIFKTMAIKQDNIVLNVGQTLEQYFKGKVEWIEEVKQETEQISEQKTEQTEQKENVVEQVEQESEQKDKPLAIDNIDKNKLTLQELIEQDIDITEADVRELKLTTNKLKVAMLLQAKSRLNTVLKLCDVLDRLYDELLNRIDKSLTTTDTASLMYTTDYIAKALSETNQFVMSLITNEKIQNFFIINNSNITNITDSRVDIDKREKIRKAAEIVLDNAEYFTNGEYDKVIDPNTAFEDENEKSDNNGSTST
jgi:hypothetical protein